MVTTWFRHLLHRKSVCRLFKTMLQITIFWMTYCETISFQRYFCRLNLMQRWVFGNEVDLTVWHFWYLSHGSPFVGCSCLWYFLIRHRLETVAKQNREIRSRSVCRSSICINTKSSTCGVITCRLFHVSISLSLKELLTYNFSTLDVW